MFEILAGVIIGGLIASVAPITTLMKDQKRWRHQIRFDHYKSERQRTEKLFDETLKIISNGVKTGNYLNNISNDIILRMPRAISEIYWEFVKLNARDELAQKNFYLDMAIAMRKELTKYDQKIMELIK